MSKRLISCVTCNSYLYQDEVSGGHQSGKHEFRANAVRNTYYAEWKEKYQDRIDFKFFVGKTDRRPLENEVILPVDDSYYGLPHKVKAVMKYAHDAGYNFVHKIDDDVAVFLPRLLHELPANDYTGYAIHSADLTYASGTHYCLSRRAMKLVAAAEIPEGEWREDRQTGEVLARNGIQLTHEPRYMCCSCDECKKFDHDAISIHTTKPEQLIALMEKQ